MSNIATLNIRFGADWSEAKKAFNEVGAAVRPMSQQLTDVGRSLTRNVSVPLAAAVGTALSASISFGSAFTGVRKTVNATEGEFEALEKGIRQMSTEIPASASAIAGVAEAAGQLGIKTDNILDFSRVMIDLGETSNLSADQAATSLARFANVTGMAQKDFGRLAATVVELGNNFETTEAEIVEMGQRLAAAGSIVGLTEAEIMAFATTLSSVGIRAEAGGTAFSKVFTELASAVDLGGSELQNFASVAGMTSTQFQQAFQQNAAGATMAFVEGLGRIQEEGGSVFQVLEELGITEIRMRNALLSAAGAGDHLNRTLSASTQAWQENIAHTEEAALRYGTLWSRLQIGWNRVTEITRAFGDGLTPGLKALMIALDPVLDGAQSLANSFKNASPLVQAATAAFIGFGIALGPVVTFLGVMLGSLPHIVAGFKLLGPLVVKLGTAFTVLRTAAAAAWVAVTGPVGIAVAGVAAFGLAVAGVIKYWDEIQIAIAATAAKLGDFFGKLPLIGGPFRELAATAREYMADIRGEAKKTKIYLEDSFFQGMTETIMGPLIPPLVPGAEGGGSGGGGGGGGGGGLSDEIKAVFTDLQENIRIATQEAEIFGGPLDAAKGKVEAITGAVKGLIAEGLDAGSAAVQRLVDDLIQARMAVASIHAAPLAGGFSGMTPMGPATPAEAAPMPGMPDLSGMSIDLSTLNKGWEEVADRFGVAAQDIRAHGEDVAIAMAESTARIGEAMQSMGRILNDGLQDAIVTLAEGIGGMIAGTAGIGDVGKALLESLATTMQQLGGMLIAFGTAGALFKAAGGIMSFLTNPFAAIAAGGLLVAAGGAIKGLLSKGGGGGAREYRDVPIDYTTNPNRRSMTGGAANAALAGADGGTAGGTSGGGAIQINITHEKTPAGDLVYGVNEENRRQQRYGSDLI